MQPKLEQTTNDRLELQSGQRRRHDETSVGRSVVFFISCQADQPQNKARAKTRPHQQQQQQRQKQQ